MNETDDTLFLSLLRPSPRDRQARRDLGDPYELHRTLSRAFPAVISPADDAGVARAAMRCLFRVDETPDGARVLVQSRVRPDWNVLTALHPDYSMALPSVTLLRPCFRVGQTLAFRLRANPTIKSGGRRQGLYDEDSQRVWLARKLTEAGAELKTVILSSDAKVRCRTSGGQSAVFSAVQCDGLLQIRDPQTFWPALSSGIGAGKGVGFGLLSLARPK